MRHLILLALFLIYSASSNALTVNISVKGDKVKYENAVTAMNSTYKTTTSEIISGLAPTKKWIPAIATTNKKLTFVSSSDQAEVDVEIWGLEYDVGGLNTTLERNPEYGLENSRCSLRPVGTGFEILEQYYNSSCISVESINNVTENIPFYFVRPLFKVKDLSEALKGKPEGVYVGSLKVPFRYYFYNSMSVLTYQNLSFNLTFQVDYIPEVFTSLVVTPENGGVMTPVYGSGTVKGATRFNVETLGYFNTGIRMKFDTSKDYSLTHDTQTTKKIPYYIHCDTCEDKIIVGANGEVTTSVLANAGVVLVPVGTDKTRINYNLTVGYSDKTMNEVVTGGYSDSFIVIFGLEF